jgi:hypothetical protein
VSRALVLADVAAYLFLIRARAVPGERACVAADHCLAGYPAIASEKTYIYDLQDGTEAESVITGVYDVWPHAA